MYLALGAVRLRMGDTMTASCCCRRHLRSRRWTLCAKSHGWTNRCTPPTHWTLPVCSALCSAVCALCWLGLSATGLCVRACVHVLPCACVCARARARACVHECVSAQGFDADRVRKLGDSFDTDRKDTSLSLAATESKGRWTFMLRVHEERTIKHGDLTLHFPRGCVSSDVECSVRRISISDEPA